MSGKLSTNVTSSRFDGDGSRGRRFKHRPEPAPQSRPCRSGRRGQARRSKTAAVAHAFAPAVESTGADAVCVNNTETSRSARVRRVIPPSPRSAYPAAHRRKRSLPETGAHRRCGLHAARLHRRRGARREYGQWRKSSWTSRQGLQGRRGARPAASDAWLRRTFSNGSKNRERDVQDRR